MAHNMITYDPPSGWKYGFPKPYNPQPDESIEGTLRRDGYPERELAWGAAKHVRFMGSQEELDKVFKQVVFKGKSLL